MRMARMQAGMWPVVLGLWATLFALDVAGNMLGAMFTRRAPRPALHTLRVVQGFKVGAAICLLLLHAAALLGSGRRRDG